MNNINKQVLNLGDDINTDDIIPANRATTYDPDILKQLFEILILLTSIPL